MYGLVSAESIFVFATLWYYITSLKYAIHANFYCSHTCLFDDRLIGVHSSGGIALVLSAKGIVSNAPTGDDSFLS